MAKYHENLLKDSTLSLLFTVKFFSSLETKMILKIPYETFLKITLYMLVKKVSNSNRLTASLSVFGLPLPTFPSVATLKVLTP